MTREQVEPKFLSEAIQRAIETCGKSRYQLSKETGIDQGTLSRFVNGRSDLKLSTIDLLLPAIGLTWAEVEAS